MGELAGRIALVTGAASGMGRAIVFEFAREGAAVIAVDKNAAQLESLLMCAEEQGFHQQIRIIDCDLIDEQDRRRLIEFAKITGTVDILVNNAGAFDQGMSALTMSIDTWERTMAINATVHFHLAQAFAPGMIAEKKDAAIIGISSAAGLVGGGGGIAYTASKHAVVGLDRALAVELGPQRIRVNTICPGVIQTPMLEAVPDEYKAKLDAFVEALPARRIGNPQEIARVAVFLASENASYIHGAVIPVDGGYTAI